jgi:hypothetical protein
LIEIGRVEEDIIRYNNVLTLGAFFESKSDDPHR